MPRWAVLKPTRPWALLVSPGQSNPRLHNVVIRNEPYYPIKGESYYQVTLQLGKAILPKFKKQ